MRKLSKTNPPGLRLTYRPGFCAQYREREAIRLCLKHFRQRNYTEVFSSLQKRTRVQLEAPLLTELYEALVERADFPGAEAVLDRAHHDGLFSEYIDQHEYRPEWCPIVPEPGADRPGMRGGHQVSDRRQTGSVTAGRWGQ